MSATAVLDSLKRAPEVLRAYRATADWRLLTVAYLRLSHLYPLQVRFRNGRKITRSDAATVWLDRLELASQFRALFAYLERAGFQCTAGDDPGDYGVSHWRLC